MELSDFIPTRGSAQKKNAEKDFVVAKYESYKSKGKIVKDEQKKSEENINKPKEFNINKVKHEIIKFGMSGFDSQKKEEAKIQLAVKLGAKPPKNKYKNYKVLLKEKQREKNRMKTKIEFQQLGKNSLGKSTAKGKGFDRKRKKKEGLLDIYGKVKISKQI